jgi:hypothetical protein
MAFQSWLMAIQENSDRAHLRTAIEAKLTGVREPPQGKNAQIMTAHMRMPGNVACGDDYWSMFACGCDTNVQWPKVRWDTDSYYTADDNWTQIFKAYTKHGAFMSQDDIERFDIFFLVFLTWHRRSCLRVSGWF